MKNLKWLLLASLLGGSIAVAQAQCSCAAANGSPGATAPRKGCPVLSLLSTKAKLKCQAAAARPAEAPRQLSPKEQRLADLATAYRADLMTPAQYQKARTRILSEP
jgi:hypothetical protein